MRLLFAALVQTAFSFIQSLNMKTRTLAFICIIAGMVGCASCSMFGNNHNISITLSESEHEYKILAHYPQVDTRKVEDYLTRKLGSESNVSFINTHIDAELTLNDSTTFYMKHEPGNLAIMFNKDRNSITSYHHIKTLGEGLKNLLKN